MIQLWVLLLLTEYTCKSLICRSNYSFSYHMLGPLDSTQIETPALESKGSVPHQTTLWEGYFFHISTTKTTISQNNLYPLNTTSLQPLPHTYGFDPSLPTKVTVFLFLCENFKLYQLIIELWLNTRETALSKRFYFFVHQMRLCIE